MFVKSLLSLNSVATVARYNSKQIKPTRYYFSSLMTKEQVVHIDGYRINYAKVGEGSHPVLLLPGAFGTIHSDFSAQLSGLDKTKFTLIAWDPPGYGKSRPPERDFPKDFYHRDAKVAGKLMEKLEIEKYSVLGWSDGGISSLILADICKKNVKKLVSYAASAYFTEKDRQIMEGIRDVSVWSPKLRKTMEDIYGKDHFSELVSAWCDTISVIAQENKGDICKSSVTNITAPTLVIQGDQDPMVPLEHAKYLSENISNAKLYLFKDGKHNLHLRYPEQFNSIIDEFLSA